MYERECDFLNLKQDYLLFSNVLPSSSPISPGEISSLEHEVLDDPVELGSLESFALGLQSQLVEVLNGLRDGTAEKTNFNATSGLTADGNIKPYLLVDLKQNIY